LPIVKVAARARLGERLRTIGTASANRSSWTTPAYEEAVAVLDGAPKRHRDGLAKNQER